MKPVGVILFFVWAVMITISWAVESLNRRVYLLEGAMHTQATVHDHPNVLPLVLYGDLVVEDVQEPPLEGTMPVFDNVADWNITDEAPVDNVERVTYFSVNLQINPEPYISIHDYLEEYCQNAIVSCDFLCWTIGNHPERCISMAEAIKMLEEESAVEPQDVPANDIPLVLGDDEYSYTFQQVLPDFSVAFRDKDNVLVGIIRWDDTDGDGKPNFRWEGSDIEESAKLFIEHLVTGWEEMCNSPTFIK